MQVLKSKIPNKIKPLLRFALNMTGYFLLKRSISKWEAEYYLKRISKRNTKGDVMRVAFIVYEPGMWDKQLPVYEEMLTRKDIEPYIIVVPDVSSSDDVKKEKQEFFLQKYQNAILCDENTLDLFKNGNFHYTFYQTPYVFKYPKRIQPRSLVRYSKLCFIPYAYIGSKDFFDVSSNNAFFQNIYFGFMDSEPMLELLSKKFKKQCERGYQNFEFLGYPAFEAYLNMQSSDSINNVLWIPRWSYAEKGGGSHFLEYKDNYNCLAAKNDSLNWAMRPHPLMFTTLANQGLFSFEQAEKYRKESENSKVYIDEHSLLNETLNSTDLLIADYSSIIVMYFLTQRPIIYCDGGIELSGVYKQLYDSMYIAKSWDDVEKFSKDILNGIDPLKEAREKLSIEIAEKHKNSSKRIADKIYDDFKCFRNR